MSRETCSEFCAEMLWLVRKYPDLKPNRKAEKARRLNQPPMSAEAARKQVERVKAGSKMGPSYGVKTPLKGQNFQLIIKGVCRLVSQHAIDRYRERLGCAGTDVRVRNRMAKSLRGAVEVKLLPEFEAGEILRHGNPARWFRRGELIFAVRDEVVTTMHKGEAERWT